VLFNWCTNAFPFGAALLRAALWQKERSNAAPKGKALGCISNQQHDKLKITETVTTGDS